MPDNPRGAGHRFLWPASATGEERRRQKTIVCATSPPWKCSSQFVDTRLALFPSSEVGLAAGGKFTSDIGSSVRGQAYAGGGGSAAGSQHSLRKRTGSSVSGDTSGGRASLSGSSVTGDHRAFQSVSETR